MATKRERPADFFDEDDDDLEYMIEASIENDNIKENDVMGLDEFLNQRSSNNSEKPGKDGFGLWVPTDMLTTTVYKAYHASADNFFMESVQDEGFDSNAFDKEEDLFNVPMCPASPREQSVTDAMDFMDLADEADVEIDLTETGKDFIAPFDPAEEENVEETSVDYREVPSTGAFITATCPTTGVSLFFTKKTPAELKRRQKTLNEIAIKKNRRSLLSKPLWQLRKDVEKSHQEELKRIEK